MVSIRKGQTSCLEHLWGTVSTTGTTAKIIAVHSFEDLVRKGEMLQRQERLWPRSHTQLQVREQGPDKYERDTESGNRGNRGHGLREDWEQSS